MHNKTPKRCVGRPRSIQSQTGMRGITKGCGKHVDKSQIKAAIKRAPDSGLPKRFSFSNETRLELSKFEM